MMPTMYRDNSGKFEDFEILAVGVLLRTPSCNAKTGTYFECSRHNKHILKISLKNINQN